MTVYLIVRGIGTLSPATSPQRADGWVAALHTADAGDWVTENITGGAYSKVIRWAFEQQGLFQPVGSMFPNNNLGAPPPVDVYIDDGRGGEYPYQPVHWHCKNIWNRRHADGGTTYEEPITNQKNYAYVKLKNRGTQLAANVVVSAYHANPAAGLLFPIDWTPMDTAQLAAPDVPANNGGEVVVGPFAWVPTHVGHECIFMVVSAMGDDSNTSNIKAGDAIPEWRLVPNDNNIGQRNVFPISGGGTSGLLESFNRLQILLKNPQSRVAEMEVRFEFPELLQRREWRGTLRGIDRETFLMEPGESRVFDLALIPGGDFTADDVKQSPDRIIRVVGYADGIAIGGTSYELEPDLQPGNPADESPA